MKQIILLIFLGTILFLASCESIELNELRDFELTIEQESDTIIQLSWTKANITNFKKYIIVRSETPIINIDRPADGFVLAEINDFNENSLTDIVTKLSADYYYRVYTELENQYLSSNQEYIHFEETYDLFVAHFIQAEQVQFTWNPIAASSFKSFIIAFSDSSINDNIFDILDLEHNMITGANFNTATHVTSNVFGLHFKLLLDLGDRIISTESLTTSLQTIPNSVTFSTIFESFEHNPHNNSLYLWENANSSTMNVFDYQQEATLQTVDMPSNFRYSVGRNQQQDELYLVNNDNDRIIVYNADNMVESHNIPLINNNSQLSYDINGFGDWIFIGTMDVFRLFSVYHRISGNLIYTSLNSTNHNKRMAILDTNPVKVLELSRNQADIHELDGYASLIQHHSASHNSLDITQNIAISPDQQYFAGLRDGLIYSATLNSSFYLPGNLIYESFAFSENSDKIYATIGKKIYKYDLATLSLEQIIEKEFPIRYIFIDNGQLIAIGNNSTTNPFYTILNKTNL